MQNIEYLDLDYFAVLPEDYAGTSDRPKCEKAPSDDHHAKLVRGCHFAELQTHVGDHLSTLCLTLQV